MESGFPIWRTSPSNASTHAEAGDTPRRMSTRTSAAVDGHQVEPFVVRLEGRGEASHDLEGVVKVAEVDQRIQCSALARDRHVREPPVSRVRHRVAGCRQRRSRAFERPQRRRHVGADDLVVSSLSGRSREHHCVAEVR